MVNNLLLQVLIALLPVGTFQLWYSRPRQMKHSRYYIGIVSGFSMLLGYCYNIHFGSVVLDLSFIAIITATLYGGFVFGVVLSGAYLFLHARELSDPDVLLGLCVFFIIYLPLLYRAASLFGAQSRSARMRTVSGLWALGLFAHLVAIAAGGFRHDPMLDDRFALFLAIYIVAYAGIAHLSFYYIEIAYERVSLQTQLRELSTQYKLESVRMRHFLDIVPLAVIFIDGDGNVAHANKIALELGDGVPGGIDGLNYAVMASRMGIDDTASLIRAVLNEGESRTSGVFKLRGRTMLATACSASEAGLGGPGRGVVFIAQDITDTQRLKDELDKMERLSLVGQMAASITHEIRNPMAVIRGFVQLLNERSPSEQRSYFRIVMEELDRANAIINDFLSLAQNRIVEKETSSLQSVLKDMMPLIWADANMRGQSVELVLCEEQDVLELNGKEIKQLILNLARNGLEAMDEKGVLKIETRDLGDRVQLLVADMGNGIPQEKLERLFEPFYTTKEQGTGLGLALCLSIAERHDGRIEVESRVGEGTTFIVTFCKQGYACWAPAAAAAE